MSSQARTLRLREPPYKPKYDTILKPRPVTAPNPCMDRTVQGWDTETRQGHAVVMANAEEVRVVDSLDDCMLWLASRGTAYQLNAWWNLDFDLGVMLKWEPAALDSIVRHGFYDGQRYSLTYTPRKLLKVKLRNGRHTFHYDIQQFYGMPLATAAEKYLGRAPHPLKEHRDDLWSHPAEDVLAYCRRDATDTRDLAARYLAALNRTGLYPKHLISPGNLAQVYLQTNADVPTWRDNSKRIDRFAWRAFRGGWFDCWQRGALTGWHYDIHSAYPAIMRDIPDTRKGRWTNEVVRESMVGFAHVKVRSDQAVAPFLAHWTGGQFVYPWYDQEVYATVTLAELRVLEKMASVEVNYAASFIPSSSAGYPYREMVDRFWALKQDAETDVAAYEISKQLLNSPYGKTCERHVTRGKSYAGTLFNPVTAATITGGARAQVADAARHALADVAMISTDSIVATKRLDLPLGDEIGAWGVKSEGADGIVVQPGIYDFGGRLRGTRGLPRKTDLRALVAGAREEIELPVMRPWTMREAISGGKWERVGVFHEEPLRVPLRNRKRLWTTRPRAFPELLEQRFLSRAYPVSFLDRAEQLPRKGVTFDRRDTRPAVHLDDLLHKDVAGEGEELGP